MGKLKSRRPSPALLVAVIALVAALGGGAVAGVAVTALNKGEKKQVKRISKKQAKKLDKKIALLPGPAGPKGATGAAGAAGQAGATDVVVRTATSSAGTNANTTKSVNVVCEPGEVAVGGGATRLDVLNVNLIYITSGPSPQTNGEVPRGWEASMATDISDANGRILVSAVCASP